MKSLRTKILYFLFPLLLLGGSIILIGSVQSGNNDSFKSLGSQATTISLDPPINLSFAGELVPMRDFEVRERMEQELIKYEFLHSATIMNIKRAARWQPAMTKILRSEGIPEDFFYLCVGESHLANATSPMGAKGFWQFLEETGRNYGLEVTEQVDERLDPMKSTEAACKYLKDAYKIFKNWTLVAASYNMGMGGLRKQMERQRVDNYYDLYLNRETAAYVFRILAIKSILEEPVKYGFNMSKGQLYPPLRYKTVDVDTTINDLVSFALAQGTTYKMVKILNPWILNDKLTVAKPKEGQKQKVYRIAIPTAETNEEQAMELIPRAANDTVQHDSLPMSPKVGSGNIEGDEAPAPVPAKPDKKKKKNSGKH
jgi:membrane-bound lytic murein transglycosylase D